MQLRQMITAGLGGIAATAVDMALLVLEVESGVAVAPAAFIAAAAGAVVAFYVNKHLAFRDPSPVTTGQLTRFACVAITNALLLAVAMYVVAVKLGVPYVAAKIVCSALVFLAWTYPAQRRLVFRNALHPARSPRLQPWMSLS